MCNTSLPLSCKYNHHPDMTKCCFLILQSHCSFYNQNVMVKLSSFEVLILDSNNCVYIHSWFESKSVQNNFKVAQVWFVFLFAQELSRNDQLSRTKEKTNYKFKIILIRIHFHLHVLIQHEHLNSCTNTAGLFSGSWTLKLWNLGYPAYAYYQKTMIPLVVQEKTS